MKITEDYQTLGGPICLDFIATLRSRTGKKSELLDQPEALAAWLTLSRLETPEQKAPLGEAELARAIALREAIYRLLESARDATAFADEDIALVNSVARGTDLAPQAHTEPNSNELALTWANNAGHDAVLATIARDAISLLTGPNINRVKPCANSKCERLFYDDSQAGRRKWCSMSRCGNQSKLSRYRARQKDA